MGIFLCGFVNMNDYLLLHLVIWSIVNTKLLTIAALSLLRFLFKCEWIKKTF